MSDNTRRTPLTLRKPVFKQRSTLLGSAMVGIPTLLLGTTAMAQDDDAPIMLDTMQIEERALDTNPYAEEGAPYKAKVSGDRRHVKELADTPQTISVLTQTMIQESGKSDLKDILAAQPGITLGTGENGNAFGDRYVIRGHEARSDVFVDGLKDPGMTTRESFAVEQVEIAKGPSSTFAGRGSTGGAINSITKQANSEYSFNKLSAGIGTDDYRRATLDSNLRITDDIAVRANLLHAYEEVPDRAPADRERNGAALSLSLQATDKLKVIADYYHLQAFDHADLGAFISRDTGKVYEDIPSYVQDEDFLKSRVDTFTLRAEYEGDNVTITNAMRYGTTNNGYFVTGAGASTRDTGEFTITTSNHQGWQEVDYFVNQLNLYFDADLAGKKHEFVTGLEYSRHNVLNGTYTGTSTGATNCVVNGTENYCLLDESGNAVSNINNLLQRDITKGDWDSDYQINTWSLYLMDTIEVNEFVSVFAGIRADNFDYDNVVVSTDRDTQVTSKTPYTYSDTLWNGHLGGTVKVAEDTNVYATWSTSNNINGGESDVGGNCGYGGLCSSAESVDKAKPESVENLELGIKHEMLDEKLLATAAIFRITKDDVMEGTDYDTAGTYNTGKNRVEGLEIGLTGNLTEKLSTQFGFSLMTSEILKTQATNRDGSAVEPGGRLANFSDRSGYLQLRYQLTDKFSFGGSATHASESYVGQPDSPAGDLYVPAYTVFDAFANYDINEQLKTRLNVGNVTDKNYYLTAYRSGTFAYIGDARNAQLTLSYEF